MQNLHCSDKDFYAAFSQTLVRDFYGKIILTNQVIVMDTELQIAQSVIDRVASFQYSRALLLWVR